MSRVLLFSLCPINDYLLPFTEIGIAEKVSLTTTVAFLKSWNPNLSRYQAECRKNKFEEVNILTLVCSPMISKLCFRQVDFQLTCPDVQVEILGKTRMHSSRIRTTHFLPYRGGLCAEGSMYRGVSVQAPPRTEWHTGVKTLPCPKFRLPVVIKVIKINGGVYLIWAAWFLSRQVKFQFTHPDWPDEVNS